MKDYAEPTGLSPAELEEEIKRLKSESDKLTDWPDPDSD